MGKKDEQGVDEEANTECAYQGSGRYLIQRFDQIVAEESFERLDSDERGGQPQERLQ